MKRIAPLPASDDKEFWEDAEKYSNKPTGIKICKLHTKKMWMKGEYFDNGDGTISCKLCPWGTRLPGYMRVKDGKVIDLRDVNRD